MKGSGQDEPAGPETRPLRRETGRAAAVVLPATAAPRRSRRHPLDGIPVTVEAPSLSEQGWIVEGIDVNVDGMGLALPREIPEGTLVLLSCHLDDRATFVRLPAQVVHSRDEGSGVRFAVWHEGERLMLVEYLIRRDLEAERKG